jgi:hypothetical protein
MINDLTSRILNIVSILMLIVMVISAIGFGIYVSRVVYGSEYSLQEHNDNMIYYYTDLTIFNSIVNHMV